MSKYSVRGLTFTRTGTFSQGTRSTMEDIILFGQGHISGSVSKKTDYLIVGDEAGSKVDKARALGIPLLISEHSFFDWFGEQVQSAHDSRPKSYENFFHFVEKELERADVKHPIMAGTREGFYTLKCEVVELEREIMREEPAPLLILEELVQVAAMCLKFYRDRVLMPTEESGDEIGTLEQAVDMHPGSLLVRKLDHIDAQDVKHWREYVCIPFLSNAYSVLGAEPVVLFPVLECEVIYDPWNVAL